MTFEMFLANRKIKIKKKIQMKKANMNIIVHAGVMTMFQKLTFAQELHCLLVYQAVGLSEQHSKMSKKKKCFCTVSR
jgi:hypothetical protein